LTQIAASSGQSWNSSFYYKLQAGSLTGVSAFQVSVVERDAAGAFLTGTFTNVATPSSTLVRGDTSRTLSNASTARVSGDIRIILTGVAIDITLRIGLPQLELGAFATSVIPTTTTALTRAADVASVNTLTPWYNQVAGTVYADFSFIGQNATSNKVVNFDAGAGFADSIDIYAPSIVPRFDVFVSGSGQAQLVPAPATAPTLNTSVRVAGAYAVNDFAACRNGGAVSTDTSGTLPSVTRMVLGNQNLTGFYLNGYLRRITYFPRRLANADLQAITT
jgi:hypothetical protein